MGNLMKVDIFGKIPVEEFRMAICQFSTSQLKIILQDIYAWKSSKLTEKQVLDVERKETIVWRALIDRAYLTKRESEDFQAWLQKMRRKRSF